MIKERLEKSLQGTERQSLEYQGKEVLSGEDKQGVFEAILDNLTDQGALAGFGAFVFIAQVTQPKHIAHIAGIREPFMDRVRILEAFLKKSNDNVRDHQLRIIDRKCT